MNLILRQLLPLTVVAFMGPSVFFLSGILSVNQRWLLLGLLLAYQMFLKVRSRGNAAVFMLLTLFAFWSVCTSFWSENYQLSLYKSLVYSLLALTLLRAGQAWVQRGGVKGCFDCFLPMVVVVYLAAVLGFFFSPAAYDGFNFQGFVFGSNMLGTLVAMTAPFLGWRSYLDWGNPRRRVLWMVACGAGTLFLAMSGSRAAMMVAFSCAAGGLSTAPKKKVLGAAAVAALLALIVVAVRPDFFNALVEQVVYKNVSSSLFYTREDVWRDSLERAYQGGVAGGGFGVSIGNGVWKGNSLSAYSYGREKGNSQLAIMEETGLVGLSLYAVFLIYLFLLLGIRFHKAEDPRLKVALGLAVGTLVGMVVHSVFEGWWTAPGAMESVFFWTVAGCALGLRRGAAFLPIRSSARKRYGRIEPTRISTVCVCKGSES